MSGLVVRPGDTLILPLLAAAIPGMTPASRERVKRALEAELPGVNVVVAEGVAGGAFVYRPDGAA